MCECTSLDFLSAQRVCACETAQLLFQVEEFYVITWDSKNEQIFEMPTGGAAIMRKGPNLLKLSRKEQCLALLTQLRTKFKTDGCFYRVFPNGEVQYLHPKDGVYPEKVNAGRGATNTNMRRIGQNANPVDVRSLLSGQIASMITSQHSVIMLSLRASMLSKSAVRGILRNHVHAFASFPRALLRFQVTNDQIQVNARFRSNFLLLPFLWKAF
jgi:hypothetical protein